MISVGSKKLDGLFIIHQDTSSGLLQRYCQDLNLRRVGIVTTHSPFPGETEAWRKLAPQVEITTFADYLSEQEMLECDRQATASATTGLSRGRRENYVHHFMRESVHHKNRIVCNNVLAKHHPQIILVAEGLGIDIQPWQTRGAQTLDSYPVRGQRISIGTRLRQTLHYQAHLIVPYDTTSGQSPALIFGAIHRLHLKDSVRCISLRLPLWGMMPARLSAPLVNRYVSAELRREGHNPTYLVCTTIHQYHPIMSATADLLGKTLHILTDGYHPSNFPAAYINSFDSGVFVVDNHCSADWFKKHGRAVRPGLWFQFPVVFMPCITRRVRCVILVLNHAGDWTALINRSDTDLLITGFAELARKLPQVEFIVRIHPTMAKPEHEGTNSIRRIKAYIQGAECTNLSISNASLAADLKRGDVYISEYSQVLIDSWSAGKLGVAVNPTRRRSFMVDYQAYGFTALQSVAAMHEWCANVEAELDTSILQQNLAVERFNVAQTAWDSEQTSGE